MQRGRGGARYRGRGVRKARGRDRQLHPTDNKIAAAKVPSIIMQQAGRESSKHQSASKPSVTRQPEARGHLPDAKSKGHSQQPNRTALLPKCSSRITFFGTNCLASCSIP
jgi:hypothetical protein